MKHLLILFLALPLFFTSCKKEEKVYTIELTANASGSLNDAATLRYRDGNGTLRTEAFTTGNWSKSFTASVPITILFEASGTVTNGDVNLDAVAVSDESQTDWNRSISSYGASTDFSFRIEGSIE